MQLLSEPILLVGYLIALMFAVFSAKRIGSFISPLLAALFLFATTCYALICGIDTLEVGAVMLVILIIMIIAASERKDDAKDAVITAEDKKKDAEAADEVKPK